MQKPCFIMGILNVTPDSFSDGGDFLAQTALECRIDELLCHGADIIDVGGESTRPGAETVDEDEELSRVLPAIHSIRRKSTVTISVDTTKAHVAREALAAGANMVNDISALEQDPSMLEVLLASQVPVVLMHKKGDPCTMQHNPVYADVVAEINAYLAERIYVLEKNGIPRSNIIVDPGLGFGKTLAHNLAILRNLHSFKQHGCRLLIGHSRKSFLGKLLHIEDPAQRDWPTAMVSAFCRQARVDILRVHNVLATRQAFLLQDALDLSVDGA
jgi:dihydropteroate synthase